MNPKSAPGEREWRARIWGIVLGGAVAGFVACSSSANQQGPGGMGAGGAGGAGGQGADPHAVASCRTYCTTYPDTCPDCAQLSPIMSSCIARCNLERTCDPTASVDECIWYRCTNNQLAGSASIDLLSAACKELLTEYFDCLPTQTVACVGDINSIGHRYINEPGDCPTASLAAACP